MRENPLGGTAGHADHEVQARAGHDDAAADRGKHRERKNYPTSLEGSRDHCADVLPLTEGIRRAKDGPSEAMSDPEIWREFSGRLSTFSTATESAMMLHLAACARLATTTTAAFAVIALLGLPPNSAF